VGQALDAGKGGLQSVPVCVLCFAALGDGDGVFEGGAVGPEAEFGKRGTAGEEVEDAADGGFLVVG